MPTRHGQSDRTPDRITNRPTWLVSRAFAQSSALLAAGFDEHGDGLRGYHDRLLAALEQWGPASQADLGRNTGIDRSDVTAALTELETRDLVERRVDPENKRRKIVTITPMRHPRSRRARLDRRPGPEPLARTAHPRTAARTRHPPDPAHGADRLIRPAPDPPCAIPIRCPYRPGRSRVRPVLG